ncbi:MAG: DNA starvation/stationary phase protection protein [Erysipelotrichaceae bacterium]|nr:DNA starvation/stationary phase protection protein [Erysipelotrichaceae bacterium]
MKDLMEKLNIYLANQQLMYTKLHNLHWYVQGRSFFTLHAKLEELYDQTGEILDEVAERILAIGGLPVANWHGVLAIGKVKELTDEPIGSDEAVKVLIADVEYWIKDTKEIVDLAAEIDDVGTADQFTGYLKEYQKLMWMLKAYSA